MNSQVKFETTRMTMYKSGVLDRDVNDMGRIFKKGTPVQYKRSKDYDEETGKWTGQFRTYYLCDDENGIAGSFTVFYQDLFIEA